ncbi:MAG: addiction module protein [Bacteroidetes bacterium]|jgi:hypothetical protein|nr:addiction module protein [Bacteroidota bacterium]
MPVLDSLKKEALKLDEEDRLHLLLKLLESFEPDAEEQNSIQDWVEEANTRYKSWKEGKMKTISEDEAFREIRSRRKDDD